MSVSVYSAVMAVIWFTVAVLVGSYTLHKASKHGLLFVAVILVLSVVRIFLPLDLDHSFIIRDAYLYPLLQSLMRRKIAGPVTVGIFLLICWAAGACICLARLLYKLILGRKFFKSACVQSVDPELFVLFYEVAEEMGYRGTVTLAISDKATTAYQTGLIHLNIVLPRNIHDFSEMDTQNMFRHELCHFLGNDLWSKLGLQIMVSILWWNPVAVLLSRNVEQMLELRCDRRVCARLTEHEQVSYLGTLVNLLSDKRSNPSKVSMDFAGCKEDAYVQQRFKMVLEGNAPTGSKMKSVMGCLLCAVLFVASYCIIWQPWGEPDKIDDIPAVGADNIYILHTVDGEYKLYSGDTFYILLEENDIMNSPFNEMQVIDERS